MGVCSESAVSYLQCPHTEGLACTFVFFKSPLEGKQAGAICCMGLRESYKTGEHEAKSVESLRAGEILPVLECTAGELSLSTFTSSVGHRGAN